jgi:F0F1-type ATP synthase epsilon subunit
MAQKITKQSTIHIKVSSPYRVYFNELAYSISAVNDTGPFDILPKHHNFMTLLNACEIIIHGPRGELKIRIARGVMHVRSDQVTVFLDV